MPTNGQGTENSHLCPSNADDFFHRALDLHRHEEAESAASLHLSLKKGRCSAPGIWRCLSALTGETTAVAPSSYVAELFDSCSDHFEERLLVDLEYRTPWELKSMLLADPEGPHHFARLLDLGCGAGLVGPTFFVPNLD